MTLWPDSLSLFMLEPRIGLFLAETAMAGAEGPPGLLRWLSVALLGRSAWGVTKGRIVRYVRTEAALSVPQVLFPSPN